MEDKLEVESNGHQAKTKPQRKESKVTIYHHFDREVHSRSSFDALTKLEEQGEERSTSPDPSLPKEADVVVDYTKVKYPMETLDYDALPTYPPRPHFSSKHFGMQLSTQLVVFDGCPNDPYHPTSMPIYQTSTFVQPSASEFGPYDYTRSGNPTRTALETIVAGLEDAHSAFAFSSGMAALSTVTRLVQAGEEIIAGDDLYGGMYRLLTRVSSRCGIQVKFVDTTNLEAVKAAITPKTKLVHIESPSNPMMRITDIKALASLLHEHKILLSVDTTMMSPICQKGLELGADIVVHSGTKFLSGHSDVIMGMVCVQSEELAKEVAFYQNAEGTGLAPFDCWLTLRGLKTLTLRVERQQENAAKVALYLIQHPLVTDVHYAGLAPAASKPWHKRDRDAETIEKEYRIHSQQSSGGGSVLSFTTGNAELSKSFVDSLRLFKVTVSFGSCNSLVELPCLLSHASIPKDRRTLPEDLVRMSIGIEDSRDIVLDIERAFRKAAEKENILLQN